MTNDGNFVSMVPGPFAIGMACEPTDPCSIGVTVPCLHCGRRYPLAAADSVVRVYGEFLGSVCCECLDPEARRRFDNACESYARES